MAPTITPKMARIMKLIVGKTIEEASKLCAKAGFRLRVTQRDNTYPAVTRDFRTDRLNVNVQNNLIVSASVG